MDPQRLITYAAAINEAIDLCLVKDKNVFIVGEGVPDPKGIFGSTTGLRKKHGKDRVMDMPVSENGLTGICIGAALRGMRPIITHQRVDFCILSFDQLINNAAKWHFMFGGQLSVPLVVRIIIGRGWGQGAQHSQSLQAIFAHIPGLKVIMPTTPYDVKGLLISAVEDNNPVICLEHRWLYNIEGAVPNGPYRIMIGKANIMQEGNDITIVAASHMAIESLRAAKILEKIAVKPEVIDLRTIQPLDEETIIKSVQKTGRLLVCDTGASMCGLAAEVITRVSQKAFSSLKKPPRRITLPDIPTPSAPDLTKNFYPGYRDIVVAIAENLDRPRSEIDTLLKGIEKDSQMHDVPDQSFRGPF